MENGFNVYTNAKLRRKADTMQNAFAKTLVFSLFSEDFQMGTCKSSNNSLSRLKNLIIIWKHSKKIVKTIFKESYVFRKCCYWSQPTSASYMFMNWIFSCLLIEIKGFQNKLESSATKINYFITLFSHTIIMLITKWMVIKEFDFNYEIFANIKKYILISLLNLIQGVPKK